MNRFAWLEKEIGEIKTNGVFVFTVGQDSVVADGLPTPLAAFLRRFGNAKMYRQRSGRFLLCVKQPVWVEWGGARYLEFGAFDFSRRAFLGLLPDGKVDVVVYEMRGRKLARAAVDFDSWLRARCVAAKAKLGARYWAELTAGPVPFSREESEILAARSAFRWERVGSTASGLTLLRIENCSTRRLPYLTFRVRDRNGKTTGRVRVATRDILPGQSAVVECDFYRKHIQPADLIVDMDEPDPSEREQFWEFRAFA
jgi:hypothetical protein